MLAAAVRAQLSQMVAERAQFADAKVYFVEVLFDQLVRTSRAFGIGRVEGA